MPEQTNPANEVLIKALRELVTALKAEPSLRVDYEALIGPYLNMAEAINDVV